MASTDATSGVAGLLYNNSITSTSTKKNSELSTESFFKLLAAQLENQDMSNPMDNSEMMTQMTQIAMMQAMDNFSTAMDDFAQLNTINYGTSMMGKDVLIASADKDGNIENHKGTVTRVDIYNGVPTVYLDDDTKTGYPVSGIMSVYEKGHAPADETDPEDEIDPVDETDPVDENDPTDETDPVDETETD